MKGGSLKGTGTEGPAIVFCEMEGWVNEISVERLIYKAGYRCSSNVLST